ncbi:hypothetical protein K8352_03325 [Flavobacteriaceae bacterium F89]|uniref:Uncharacterized protein n=1 Tax=Cerina litoralis TaxID=2874477 RepID=A0AAE3ESR3_9FLAO|nr:BfmA/BtgA family mobilization protein [Cerina litoralis]MCG2459768.1 hypothetical protein [Cerina litoralis]
MDAKKPRKSTFSAISINRITASRFRVYSKKTSKSHTDTLDLMMDFFEGAKISPKNKYLMDYMRLNHYMDKRMDYMEVLLRAWEKNDPMFKIHDHFKQILIFAEKEEERKKRDDEFAEAMYSNMKSSRNVVPKYDYDLLVQKGRDERERIYNLVKKINPVRPNFGKPYCRIDIDENELERLMKAYYTGP